MTLDRRRFLALSSAALILPSRALAATAITGPAFGSHWRAVVPEGTDPARVTAIVTAVTARIDATMSPWRPDSTITAANRGGAGRHALDPETRSVLAAALGISEETGGAFDPTMGPVLARHGFGPIEGAPGGLGTLSLTPEGMAKENPLTTLDLCGIAKGHALDRIISDLHAAGLSDMLVELGGEVATRGRHPSGRPWQVAAEGARGLTHVLAPGEMSVATSGTTAQGYDLGDRRISHIVDPATAAPVAGDLVAVSVFDADPARADALSTALMAMGASRAAAFAEGRGLPAILSTANAPPIVTGGAGALILGEIAA